MSKIIMVNSPEAEPELVTETFYKTKSGYLYSHDDEGLRLARYQNCTHRWCDECRQPTEKFYTHCPECREKSAIERYLKREIKAWPDETPAYSEVAEEYFYSYDDIDDYWRETGINPEDLRLILCEPVYADKLDYDYFSDQLAEDHEAPDELIFAVEAFNAAIDAYGKPLSWEPGKYRVEIKQEDFL